MQSRENLALASARVDDGDGAAFAMIVLPLGGRESAEFSGDADVKRVGRALDAIVRATTRYARETLIGRQIEQQGKIGSQAGRRHPIRGREIGVENAAARTLIRVRGEKEAVDEDDRPRLESRPQHALHQLRTRRHEQKRFGSRDDVGLWIEQDPSNLVAENRPAGLAHGDDLVSTGDQPLRQQSELGAFPRALRAFENYQHWFGANVRFVGVRSFRLTPNTYHLIPPSHRQSVMMLLVAPFSMPSRIQSFTFDITLSKFSCATSNR